jgi:glycosyltransferase involved in cell wall biosynthesis
MKVTIITVAFNAAKTIGDTLSSVASQTYPDIEHILVDGDSTDGTQEVIKEYQHVAHFISEKDEGLYFAMNKGLALATGDLVAVLNADDFYTSTSAIEKVVNMFKLHQTDSVS